MRGKLSLFFTLPPVPGILPSVCPCFFVLSLFLSCSCIGLVPVIASFPWSFPWSCSCGRLVPVVALFPSSSCSRGLVPVFVVVLFQRFVVALFPWSPCSHRRLVPVVIPVVLFPWSSCSRGRGRLVPEVRGRLVPVVAMFPWSPCSRGRLVPVVVLFLFLSVFCFHHAPGFMFVVISSLFLFSLGPCFRPCSCFLTKLLRNA